MYFIEWAGVLSIVNFFYIFTSVSFKSVNNLTKLTTWIKLEYLNALKRHSVFVGELFSLFYHPNHGQCCFVSMQKQWFRYKKQWKKNNLTILWQGFKIKKINLWSKSRIIKKLKERFCHVPVLLSPTMSERMSRTNCVECVHNILSN